MQGGIGDFFYVVETGALDVFVSRNGGPRVKVTDYGPNGSFGELALMYNAPRAATVVSTKPCTLWALDRVTFRRILMENTSRKRRMYEEFLEDVKLLADLEPYERKKYYLNILKVIKLRTLSILLYTMMEILLSNRAMLAMLFILLSLGKLLFLKLIRLG